MLVLNILLLVVGFVCLIKGADWFVDGSSSLARHFKVPGVIIGLTIVALGTSAPELAVSVSAAMQGSNEIALSNVVGSNIFNLLSVLGVCAVLHPVPVDAGIMKRDFPLSIGASIMVFIIAGSGMVMSGRFFDFGMDDPAGSIGRTAGIVILGIFLVYIFYLIYDARKNPAQEEEGECLPLWKCFCFILIGLFFIVGGGQVVVYAAKEIARTMGMSETLIGLTVVAVGTSLPELVTSAVAAKKGETGLAVGNVVGSNLFNLMLILGISTSIHPITVNAASVYDMLALIFISMITYAFALKGRKIGRPEGVVMLLLYVADVAFAILR